MSQTLESAFAAVQPLVAKFSAHEAAYMSQDFGETSVRCVCRESLTTVPEIADQFAGTDQWG